MKGGINSSTLSTNLSKSVAEILLRLKRSIFQMKTGKYPFFSFHDHCRKTKRSRCTFRIMSTKIPEYLHPISHSAAHHAMYFSGQKKTTKNDDSWFKPMPWKILKINPNILELNRFYSCTKRFKFLHKFKCVFFKISR